MSPGCETFSGWVFLWLGIPLVGHFLGETFCAVGQFVRLQGVSLRTSSLNPSAYFSNGNGEVSGSGPKAYDFGL